jgi:alanine racemase
MRPTHAEIDLSAIHHNLIQVRKRIGRSPLIMAVVKANAYGHGIVPVARAVLKNKTADYLGVAIIEEAVALRQQNVDAPILVLTPSDISQLETYLRFDVELTLCSLRIARRLNYLAKRLGKKAVVHIKVDTGMGRVGIQPADVFSFIRALHSLSHLIVKGIYTHFATSDVKNLSFARTQLEEFRALVNGLTNAGIHIPIRHCANSGAILQLQDSFFDMVRPGIMMYGHYPSHETRKTVSLKPAMAVRSSVGFMKTVEKGTSISYGRKYYTSSRTGIATVTAGYADGISRRLTNKINALIGGKRYPIVGTICMDQLMIDVGSRSRVKEGDAVTLMGKQGKEEISAWEISDILGTIPYEVCSAISERVPRKYLHG